MKIERYFSSKYHYPASDYKWKFVSVTVKDGATGEVKFSQEDVEVPQHWSDNAAQILASKYFRKAGVEHEHGTETSAKQVFHRLAGCWTDWGKRAGLLSEDDAKVFYDECYAMLALQVAAPNSPQWFNTGLHYAYGITGPKNGQWSVDYSGDEVTVFETDNSYERPQPHACFIQPVNDDLVNPGGIMDLWEREVRLFKHGSGTGTNFSSLRAKGERLSGGGISSGLMSFLKIGDQAAGAIKSGGTTRRAAKMVIVDVDHPEIEDFIDWKVREESKAAAMYVGSQVIRDESNGVNTSAVHVPQAMVDRLNNGFYPEIFGVDYEGEAITSVQGQNSNNSVRIPNRFITALEKDDVWTLTERTTGKQVKHVKARELWERLCRAAWACADPGVQFDDTINEWHTCSADGRINASNPCSEYMFLDNTACNLASLNLVKFLQPDGTLNLEAFEHAVRIWTLVLEISVEMASFPSKEIALGSYNYRTLGLGYANLGALLMRMAIPYDSHEGRGLAAGITALMTGISYLTSAEMALEVGPFPRWKANCKTMRRVLSNHSRALYGGAEFEGLTVKPTDFIYACDKNLLNRARVVWSQVLEQKSFRNAQVTLIAPTGTISFVMDCDTTGIEPDFALIKHKFLAGGGTMTIANQSIEPALARAGYPLDEVGPATAIIRDGGSLTVAGIKEEHHKIFECANEIDPLAHVNMVGAVQPFLSGAVSKTINMPNSSTVKDVANVYRRSHNLGLKSVALYRDGSKLTQPLTSHHKVITKPAPVLAEVPLTNISELRKRQGTTREKLPWRRERGYTQKVKIDGNSVYHTVSEYPDGRLGELFLELAHEGSTLRSMGNLFAISVSLGLQHGVPLKEYVDAFLHTRFEPAGFVEGHDCIKMCTSIADYIARDLGITYLHRDELANIPRPDHQNPEPMEQQDTRYIPSPAVGSPVTSIGFDISSTAYKKVTGNICPECHSATLVTTGTCTSCWNCSYNTGCG